MQKQRGFTLIEIAIVLVIIGLLLGGVLKGQELIKNAKVRNTISSMDELKAAIFGFQDRYRATPGDMLNASTLVGTNAVNCTGSKCGNGLIEPWPETSIVTNNLSVAGFYTGAFSTKIINAIPTAATAPTNPWGGAMFVAYWYPFNENGARSKVSRPGIYTGGGISSAVLAEIDRKIDDGNPGSGSFRAGYPYDTSVACVAKNTWVTAVPGSNCAGTNLY
ncbi:MAG: prepilin-type N-terminal cleavage/methylation domain-containing protein [Methylococcales bacterium]